MRAFCIDPGVAATGLALVGETRRQQRIYWSTTVKTAKGDGSFQSLHERAWTVANLTMTHLTEHCPDLIVCEAFEDIAPLRGASRRYYTPYLIGILDALCMAKGHAIVFQSPQIKRAWREYKEFWSLGQSILPGDNRLKTEHERDAAIHGLHFLSMEVGK